MLYKKFFKFSSVIILCIFILTSCKYTNSMSASEVLEHTKKEFKNLPDGFTYLKSAEEGDDNFLPSSTISILYGSDSQNNEFTLIEDYAIYISSFAVPCEIAVFKCYSSSDTQIIASMCLERISSLSFLLQESDFRMLVDNAKVEIYGKFVVMTMAQYKS